MRSRRLPGDAPVHGKNIVHFRPYGTLSPGGNVYCLPLIFNRYPDPDASPAEEDYIAVGIVEGHADAGNLVRIYDPFYRTCAFGTNAAGEVIEATYSHYANRYITVGSYGLTRTALLSADLTVGGNAAAAINCDDPDGDPIGSLEITAYSHQTQGNTLASGSKIIVHYMTSERKWYTGAYYDAT